MADFMTKLWESVFTPGPTPTLLIAANASFGTLQVLLLALFFATWSYHFVALSVICAGTWWGINWFAAELQKAQAAEEEAAKIRKRRRDREGSGKGGAETSGGEGGDEHDALEDSATGEEGEDGTETETEVGGQRKLPKMSQVHIRGGPGKIQAVLESAKAAREGDSGATGSNLGAPSDSSGLMKRRSEGETSSADLSSVGTDSEWEKVSETEK
jgi:ER protein Pkr1